MPSFNLHKWNSYQFRVLPRDGSFRDFIYTMLFKNGIIPYFYGTNIIFDLAMLPPRGARLNETFEYIWELRDSDGDKIIKRGKDSIITRSLNRPTRKAEAIKIGYLSKVQQYQLTIRFISSMYGDSEIMTAVDFTLLDRDIFNMKLIWILAGAIVGVVIGYFIGS